MKNYPAQKSGIFVLFFFKIMLDIFGKFVYNYENYNSRIS